MSSVGLNSILKPVTLRTSWSSCSWIYYSCYLL